MKRLVLALAGVACLAPLTAAQLSGVAAPNPAPQGTPITITLEATSVETLRLACPIEVRQGSTSGPVVWSTTFCIGLLVQVGPGRPYNRMGWQGVDMSNNPVPPGDYFILVEHRNSGPTWVKHWVPVRVDPTTGPTAPVLTPGGAFTRGQTTTLDISSPPDPGMPYAIYASFTTNTGFATSFGNVALDFDALFLLSASQTPGLFLNLQSTLGAGGTAMGAISIPNLAFLQGQNLAFQGAVISGSTVKLTNAMSGIIQ